MTCGGATATAGAVTGAGKVGGGGGRGTATGGPSETATGAVDGPREECRSLTLCVYSMSKLYIKTYQSLLAHANN